MSPRKNVPKRLYVNYLRELHILACKLQFPICPLFGALELGEQVTTLFGTPEVQSRTKHSMLPILTALFLLSYGLMTLLIVEQGTTIESQRTLIRQLFTDSTELSALKGNAIRAAAPTPKPQADTQASAPVHTPSTQAVPSEKASTAKNHKAQRPLREKPPVPASDIADARRTLMSI